MFGSELIIVTVILAIMASGFAWLTFACPVGGSPALSLPSSKASVIQILLMGVFWAGTMAGLLVAGFAESYELRDLLLSTIVILIGSLIGGFRGNEKYARELPAYH